MSANPIVWKKSRWRWHDRRVPWRLSFYEYHYGIVAARRLRPPGWVITRDAMREITIPKIGR